ncbi:unnamed protein product [Sphagnum jensenii]|uniref:Uncharacterized protein n=1 Tax=Sphagnum jensenii TaxID=128206 RepID=A0ABP0XHF9_9BRYO
MQLVEDTIDTHLDANVEVGGLVMGGIVTRNGKCKDTWLVQRHVVGTGSRKSSADQQQPGCERTGRPCDRSIPSIWDSSFERDVVQ